MLRIMLRTLSIAPILLAGAGIAHADVDIYRWKDAQGIYHYSDQWVPGSELIKSNKQHVNVPIANASRSASASAPADDSPPPEPAPSSDSVQAVKQDMTKVREQQCREARDNYDKAIHARRIFKTGKDGAKEYISDTEADAYRARVRNDMDQLCGTSSR